MVAAGTPWGAVSSIVASHTLARLRQAVLVVNMINWALAIRKPDPWRVLDLIGTTCEGWVRFPWELP